MESADCCRQSRVAGTWLLATLLVLLATSAIGRAADAGSVQDASNERFAAADRQRDEGRFREALAMYRALRGEADRAGDIVRQWRAQLGIADMLRRNGDAAASEAALDAALALAAGDPRRVAATRLGVCNLHSYRGESEAALAECGAALAMAESIRDR